MNKEKIFTVLTTILVVIAGIVIANSFLVYRQVDASGKVVPDGTSFKAKLGFGKK
jgi:hypothetical protein